MFGDLSVFISFTRTSADVPSGRDVMNHMTPPPFYDHRQVPSLSIAAFSVWELHQPGSQFASPRRVDTREITTQEKGIALFPTGRMCEGDGATFQLGGNETGVLAQCYTQISPRGSRADCARPPAARVGFPCFPTLACRMEPTSLLHIYVERDGKVLKQQRS